MIQMSKLIDNKWIAAGSAGMGKLDNVKFVGDGGNRRYGLGMQHWDCNFESW